MTESAPSPTLLRALSRRAALGVLLLLLALTATCLAVSGPAKKIDTDPTDGRRSAQEEGDWDLYRAIAARVRAGEGYYDAVAAELHPRGYPSRSVLNWRTPLHLWLMGHLPPWLIKALLVALSLPTLLLTWRVLERAGPRMAWAGVVLQLAAFLPCLAADVYLFPEVWAGLLIALSAALLAREHHVAGAGVGLAAFFLRELAGLHCVVGLGLALWAGRRREAAVWGVGFLAYAGYLALHAQAVLPRISPEAIAVSGGWLKMNGPAFVLSTARMHPFLLVFPAWVAALVVPSTLLGLVAWPEPRARAARLTPLGYAAAFLFVGHLSNFYWGPIYTPLLALGMAWALPALRDLGGAIARPQHHHLSPPATEGAPL